MFSENIVFNNLQTFVYYMFMVSITERRIIIFLHGILSRFVKTKFVVRSTSLLNLKSFVNKSGVSLKATTDVEILTDDKFHKLRPMFINFIPLFSKNINFKNSFQVVSSQHKEATTYLFYIQKDLQLDSKKQRTKIQWYNHAILCSVVHRYSLNNIFYTRSEILVNLQTSLMCLHTIKII